MKKIFYVLAVIGVISLGLTACDDTNSKKSGDSNTTVVTKAPSKKVTEAPEKVQSGDSTDNPGKITTETPIEAPSEPSTSTPEVTDKKDENSEYTLIKFSDMYETKGTIKNVSTMLKNLNGKKVQIKGYPAVQSPLDESFVYLNNQPFVTCPFCTIGDATKLEVIPIFMANKSKIKYTENALNVYGTLEVASKLDSEGYTTQFRIYADKVEEVQDTGANKIINEYYSSLSQGGMIYDIQTLQMNIEYATNPQYMAYYDNALQTGKSKAINNVTVVKAIAEEYLSYDSQYGGGYGSGFGYLDYIKECPGIVKQLAPTDSRLISLNDELIELYNKEIVIMEKYQNICYEIYQNADSITTQQATGYINQLKALNPDNLKLYEQFTAWNNKLRE